MRSHQRPLGIFFSCAVLLGCSSPKKPDNKPAPVAPATTAASAPASTPAASLAATTPAELPFIKEKQVLYDGRTPLPKMPALPEAEAERLLSKLFPKRLKKLDDCIDPDSGAKSSEEDLAAGQFAPSVEMYATGSFTKPGLSLTLYVVDLGECNAEAGMRTYGGTSKNAYLFNKDELIQTFESPFRGDWLKVVDIEQDGIDEVFLVDEQGDNSGIHQVANLYRLSQEEATTVEGFEERVPYDNSCEAVDEDEGEEKVARRIVASVLSYTPTERGKMPTFSSEDFEATCKKGAPFKKTKE